MSTSHFLKIEFTNNEKLTNEYCEKFLPFAKSQLFFAPILSSKLLTKGEDVKKIYQITFDVQNINFKFECGDTIGILPCNDETEVEKIINRLGLDELAEVTYKLSILSDTSKRNAKIPSHLPKTGTIRNLFKYHVSIRSPPKKLFLQSLVNFTESEEENKKLRHLCSKEGSKSYLELLSKNCGFLDIFNLFPSCRPPLEVLLEHIPPLQPRPYSICSSPLKIDQLSIVFSVVTLEDGKKGVCTSWLEKLIKQTTLEDLFHDMTLNSSKNLVPFYFREPKVRFPEDPETPVILIGPGTGVAPFIGFLESRLLQNKKSGVTWLYFGCRYSDRDFIFKKELQNFKEKGFLTDLFCCFSREGDKQYVQDLLRKNGKEIAKNISSDSKICIYVCGDAKNMMKNVKDAIVECLKEFGQFDDQSAVDLIKKLRSDGRYVEDFWL